MKCDSSLNEKVHCLLYKMKKKKKNVHNYRKSNKDSCMIENNIITYKISVTQHFFPVKIADKFLILGKILIKFSVN